MVAFQRRLASANRFRITGARAKRLVDPSKLGFTDIQIIGSTLDIFCSIGHFIMTKMNAGRAIFIDKIHRAFRKLHQTGGCGLSVDNLGIKIRFLP
jgi:hypothetical protein